MYQDLTIAKFDEQIAILTEQKDKQEAYYDEALELLDKQLANLDFLATQAAFQASNNNLTKAQFEAMIKTYFPTLSSAQMQTVMAAFAAGANAIVTAQNLVGGTYDSGGIASGLGLMKKATKMRETVLGPDITKTVLDPQKSAQFTALVQNLDTLLSGNLASMFNTAAMGASQTASSSSSQVAYHFEKLILPNVTDSNSFIEELNKLQNIVATSRNL